MCARPHWNGPPRVLYIDPVWKLNLATLLFSIRCSLFTWEKRAELCFSARFAVFGCVCVKPQESLGKTSYFLPPSSEGKALQWALHFIKLSSFLMQTGPKYANVAKGRMFERTHTLTVLHCTELSRFLLHGCALSCVVSSRSTLCHIPAAFESEALPAVWTYMCVCVCACVCMCLWGPGMKPTATASSDLMQKAAGSNTIHYSLLCASSLPLPLSPVIMVSPVTKHFVTHGRKPWWGLGGVWGLLGCRNVTCVDGLWLDLL